MDTKGYAQHTITTPINGAPATFGHGSTLGFPMQSPEQAEAFHAAGVANGGTTCEDPPGYREGLAGKLLICKAGQRACLSWQTATHLPPCRSNRAAKRPSH